MMSPVVLDREVAISGHPKYKAGQQLFESRVPVPELVGCIDCDSADHARMHSEQSECPPAEISRSGIDGATEDDDEVQGYRQPGQPTVLPVCFELHKYFFGWVVPIFAYDVVENRHDHEIKDEWQGEPELVAAAGMERHRYERLERVHHG